MGLTFGAVRSLLHLSRCLPAGMRCAAAVVLSKHDKQTSCLLRTKKPRIRTGCGKQTTLLKCILETRHGNVASCLLLPQHVNGAARMNQVRQQAGFPAQALNITGNCEVKKRTAFQYRLPRNRISIGDFALFTKLGVPRD